MKYSRSAGTGQAVPDVLRPDNGYIRGCLPGKIIKNLTAGRINIIIPIIIMMYCAFTITNMGKYHGEQEA